MTSRTSSQSSGLNLYCAQESISSDPTTACCKLTHVALAVHEEVLRELLDVLPELDVKLIAGISSEKRLDRVKDCVLVSRVLSLLMIPEALALVEESSAVGVRCEAIVSLHRRNEAGRKTNQHLSSRIQAPGERDGRTLRGPSTKPCAPKKSANAHQKLGSEKRTTHVSS